MKKAIRRWAAWILVGVLLFNLIPINPTHAGEKANVVEQGISMDKSDAEGQDITEDESAGSGKDITTEKPADGDSDASDSSSEASTEDKQADNGEANTSENASGTQDNTTENGNQDVPDTTGTAATENNTTGKEDTEAITTEKSTETPEVTEEQTNSEKEDFNEKEVLSDEDELMLLDAEESSKKEHKLVGTISKVVIDGNVVNSGDTTEVNKDSKIEIRLEYKINNSDNVKINEPCYYDLNLQGVTIKVNGNTDIFDGNNKKVGEWKYENGKLVCWFTSEDFLKKSNVSGKIDLEGSLNLDDVKLDDDGFGQIRIDDKFYDIHVDKEDCPDEVKVSKSIKNAPKLLSNSGLVEAEYEIVITALTDAKEVEFRDQVGDGNYMWIYQYYPNITSDKRGRLIEDTFTKENDIKYNNPPVQGKYGITGFSGTIHRMTAGEVITITYTVRAHVDLWNQGMADQNPNFPYESFWKERYDNEFTVTNRFGKEVTVNKPLEVKPIEVSKSGDYSEKDGTVTWAIEINNPYRMHVASLGMKLNDNLKGYKDGIYKGDFNITINGTKIDWLTFSDFIGKDITLNELIGRTNYFSGSDISYTEEKYTIVYTMTVTDDFRYNYKKKTTDTNTVTAAIEREYTDGLNTTAQVGIGVLTPLLAKNGEVVNDEEIAWTITFNVPGSGLENPVISDVFEDVMELDAGTIEIKDSQNRLLSEGTDYNLEIKDPGPGFDIEFIGTLLGGTYTITYITTYDITDNIPTYENKATVTVGDYTTSVTGKANRPKKFITKGAVISSTGSTGTNVTYNGTAVQTWRLDIKKDFWRNMEGNYYIEDIWTSGYDYVDGSLVAHPARVAANSEDTYKISPVILLSNGIHFDISDAAQYANDYGWENLYITYQTKIKDELQKDFLNGQSYKITNKAVLCKDGKPVDISSEVTATSNPKKVVEKTGDYDEYTAPYAEYSICVNWGSNDLVPGDTLEVKDTLPADFELVEDSLQVYHADLGNRKFTNKIAPGEPLAQGEWQYVYDMDKNVLTITIPDETEVIIKYKVIIKKNSGESLTEENSTNVVSLGVSGIESSEASYSILMEVQKTRAVAESTTADLTIHKYDKEDADAKGLAGAQFQIQMVDYDSATGKITDPAVNTPQGYKGSVSLTTDGKGNCMATNLYFDHLYKVVETKAPEGYVLDDTPRYFVVVGHDNESGKEDAKKLYPNGTTVYSVEDSRIMSIGNEKETETTTETTTEITTEEKTTEEKTTEEKTTTNSSKKTGDNTPIGALAGLMVFGTTTVVFIRRRKKKLINN